MAEGLRPRSAGTRLSIARAVPAGSRRARGQKAWLADVCDAMAGQGWRRDRLEHWEAVARTVAHHADWHTQTTMPLWDRLAAKCGTIDDASGERRPLSRSTVARALAWLRAQGYLGVVESGSVPWLRPMALDGTEGNRGAVYLLTTPGRHASRRAVRVNDTPSRPRSGLGPRRTHARAAQSTDKRRPPGTHPENRRASPRQPAAPSPDPAAAAPARPRESFSPCGQAAPAVAWSPRAAPKTRIDEAAAARAVMNGSHAARSLSDRYVAHICRDFFRAGWSPSDILRAVDYRPAGDQWRLTGRILHPAGWMKSRLGEWRDGGRVLPAPSAAALAAAAAAAAAERARRQELAAARARAAPPERQASAAAAARAALAAASPAAARIIAIRNLTANHGQD